MKKEKWLIALATGAGLAAISYKLFAKDIPDGATAVKPFDKYRYLGKWNEIARLPNRIEKNIKFLTEDYSFDNDSMTVVTRGYNTKKNEWKEFSGKIIPNGPENQGMLKVSYFGPFYVAYNILALDKDYKYALVSGSGLNYLWILSRESSIPDEIRTLFLDTAVRTGFRIDKLEWM